MTNGGRSPITPVADKIGLGTATELTAEELAAKKALPDGFAWHSASGSKIQEAYVIEAKCGRLTSINNGIGEVLGDTFKEYNFNIGGIDYKCYISGKVTGGGLDYTLKIGG